MDKKIIRYIFLIGSILCLIIAVKLFWNTAIFVDATNTSPAVVYGGEFWNYMAWLQLILLSILTIAAAANAFRSQ